MVSIRDAVIATVCYADIFDYPLTDAQLKSYLIKRKFKKNFSLPSIKGLKIIHKKNETFVMLSKRKGILRTRKLREVASIQKWQKVERVGKWLAKIPTVTMVGVTGALAVNNAHEEDDIDLFIIAQAGTLWITRLLVVVIMSFFGRRKPGDTEFKNAICLNMFITGAALSVPRRQRDLFTAHEVLQMVPVIDKGNTYIKFLRANRWVTEFLPALGQEKIKALLKLSSPSNSSTILLRLCEPLARFIQLRYMSARRTTEVISDTILRFHPRDARAWIKTELDRRLRRFGIPLDKIFYSG